MDAKQIWQRALEKLQVRVSPAAYAIWCSASISPSPADNRVIVSVPVRLLGEHQRLRFQEQVRIAISEVIGKHTDVVLRLQPLEPVRPDVSSGASRQGLPTRRPQVSRRQARHPEVAQQIAPAYEPRTQIRRPNRRTANVSVGQPPLPLTIQAGKESRLSSAFSRPPVLDRPVEHRGSRYSFETFVVGAANHLAFAAAREVAGHPGEQYNPLLIAGGPGLGKTHLLQAIGHYTEERGLVVAYVTAERFTNEIIEAIRQSTTDAFRAHYRAVDILLVDDVQFIAGKESTEEEFFHTFNTLHEAGKQIVLSSDRMPRAMSHLHDRLRSRFQWGLVADLDTPSFEHRLAILRAKAAVLPVEIPEDVLLCLARPENQNIRALEGSLNRVVASAQILGQPLDTRLVTWTLAPLSNEPADRSPEDIIAAVAEHFSVPPAALTGKSRERAVAWARQIAMYLLRHETTASLLQIGQRLGDRDHTTVLHGCQRVSRALDQSDLARADIAAIRSALRS
jgi:chromosomal replication initiator protein